MEVKGVRAEYVRVVWALGIRNCHGDYQRGWAETVNGVKWTVNAKNPALSGSRVGQGWLEVLATTDGYALFVETGFSDDGQINVVNVRVASDVPYSGDWQQGTLKAYQIVVGNNADEG